MTTPTDARPELLTVIANMKAKPGQEDALREGLLGLVEATTQEAGFVNYDVHEAIDAPGTFYLYENWESGELLDAHLAAPHLVAFAERIPELLDDSGLTITRLKRIG